jgi:hypothetical protein
MEPKNLFTVKWSQPYSQRPYLHNQHDAYEQLVERFLRGNNFKEANEIIERIRNASKN